MYTTYIGIVSNVLTLLVALTTMELSYVLIFVLVVVLIIWSLLVGTVCTAFTDKNYVGFGEQITSIATNPSKLLTSDLKVKLYEVWKQSHAENREFAGRVDGANAVVDIKGDYDRIKTSDIDYNLPGIRFHTHPKIVDMEDIGAELTIPSDSDYFNILKHSKPEYVLTQHGIWIITPRDIDVDQIIPGMLLYSNSLMVHTDNGKCRTKFSKKRFDTNTRESINKIANTYANLISKPNGNIVNFDQECSTVAVNLALESFNQLYDHPDHDSPGHIMYDNLEEFVKLHPLKVVWKSWVPISHANN